MLGFTDKNKSKNGQELTREVLRYLARRPATARRIARRLAVKFVHDDPPAGLVEQLAKVYLKNDTAIVPVLRALVRSSAFKGAAGRKVRDPSEDVVATYRALGARVDKPRDDSSAANVMLWQAAEHRLDAVLLAPARRPAARQRRLVLAVAAARVAVVPLRHGRAAGGPPST